MTFKPTEWIDGRLAVLGKSVSEGVVDAVGDRIDAAVVNLGGQIVANADHVVTSLGSTVTDVVGHVTVDTATLAQAVANAIKGLLPFPFRSRKP